jgi:hypothetical protein
MATLSFANAAACAGGNHATVDVSLGALTYRLPISRDELLTPLSNDEKKELCRLILRARIAILTNPTPLQMRNAIQGLTLEIQL